MFGPQTKFFVIFGVCLACSLSVAATVTKISATFSEVRESLPYAAITGTLYYLFDDTNSSNCRLRFDYVLKNNKVVSNLYHYGLKAMYSMCTENCSANSVSDTPDPWWNSQAVYTKSDEQESGMFWYDRKSITGQTGQVKRILMADSATPSADSVKAIKFNDGRTVYLSNFVVNPNIDNKKFETDSSLDCPVPTCSMYADIVFVLDCSNSVDKDEWNQTKEFVVEVLKSFTFGDRAAAAAVVKFWEDTAIVAAGQGIGGQSVSTDVDDLIDKVKANKHQEYHWTYLGCGLNRAMEMFDRSSRKNNDVKPHKIVIFVTDGEDSENNQYNKHYVARTEQSVSRIKGPEYDAFLIGVGVGLQGTTGENRIKNYSSYIGSEKAYFLVDDYASIKSVAERLFSPLCDEFNSECGPSCHGFCGCGQCLCPKCQQSGGICEEYDCEDDGISSNGCELKELHQCNPDTKCAQYTCDDSTGTAKCIETKTCQEMIDNNPGTCRTVNCDPKTGSCSLSLNHNICTSLDTSCVKYECAGNGVVPDDVTTGCKVKRNITQECVNQNKDCFEYTCDMNTGTCTETDTCKKQNTKCVTYACTKRQYNNQYYCKDTNVPRPSGYVDNKCVTYKCDPAQGWKIDHEETEETCRDGYDFPNKNCRTYWCDTKEGCQNELIEGCGEQCDNNMVSQCRQDSQDSSSLEQCQLKLCKVKEDPISHEVEPYCAVNKSVNCLESEAADEAREMNKDPSVCYTVECQYGKCVKVEVYKEIEDSKCVKNVCEEYSAGWHWVVYPTEENISCVTDECKYRVCDPEGGCIATEICNNRTTLCKTYGCTEEGKCVVVSEYDYINTACLTETCNANETGIDKHYAEDVNAACDNSNKCIEMSCSESGECIATNSSPPGNDKCLIYECDPEVGWTSRPKCDDGIFCTIDRCSVVGECWHSAVNCNEELNMTDYPCFRAECKEGDGNYSCKRKKRDGVYIDVCGNCVRQDGNEASSDDDLADPTACVQAPEEPNLKEGLAAASIAMIVLLAVLIGAAVAASTVFGTKALLDRARGASNQSVVSNPLFEDSQTEMTNPAFAGDTV